MEELGGPNVGYYNDNGDSLEDINDAARYADISYQWAVSEELVDDGTNIPDNSSKFYATASKLLFDEIQDISDDADRAEQWGQLAVVSAVSAGEDATQTALDVIDTTEDALSTGEDATSAEQDALRAELAADRAEAAGAGSTGVIGEMKWFPTDHTNPTIRSGYVMPLGQEFDRTGEYSALWAEVLSGRLPSVTEAEWQGGQSAVYSTGDGSTTFRIPNMAGHFLRIAGAADPDFATRLPGQVQVDEVGGHEHVTTNTLAAASVFTGIPVTPIATSTFTGSAMGTHVHANTATGAAHTHAGASHTHGYSRMQSMNSTSGQGSQGSVSIPTDGTSGYVWTGGGQTTSVGLHFVVNREAGDGASATTTGAASSTTVSVTNVASSAGTPTGTVATTVTDVSVDGTVVTTLSGDVIVAPSTGAESRPINSYIQPYIVYAAAQEVAGLQIRGIWDVPNNTIVGDTLNFSIVKDVAPQAPDGGFTNGIAYKVIVGGSFDLNGDPTLEILNVGDFVVWFGAEWVQIAGQPVTSVNTLTGDVTIHGENANIDDVTPTTIKAYIDTADGTKAELVHTHVIADVSGVVPIAQIPVANNSAAVGSGFGGFRYQVTGTTLDLFTT
jgi:hypothetical protein